MKRLLVLLLLTGCGYAPMVVTNSMIIIGIEQDIYHIDRTRIDGCLYHVETNTATWTYTSEAMFFAPCGLYNIGDTITIIKK